MGFFDPVFSFGLKLFLSLKNYRSAHIFVGGSLDTCLPFFFSLSFFLWKKESEFVIIGSKVGHPPHKSIKVTLTQPTYGHEIIQGSV